MTPTIIIPGPPVPWARARRAGARYFVDAKTAAYKTRVTQAAHHARVKCIPKPHAVDVTIGFFLPRPKSNKTQFPIDRRDVDNLAKGILDALNGVAFEDDGQVITLIVHKRWATEEDPPGAYVQIERIDA